MDDETAIANLKKAGRTVINHNGRWLVFVSTHPLEERLLELTDDYRDSDGIFLVPEAVAWDGVETCPGVVIRPHDSEAE